MEPNCEDFIPNKQELDHVFVILIQNINHHLKLAPIIRLRSRRINCVTTLQPFICLQQYRYFANLNLMSYDCAPRISRMKKLQTTMQVLHSYDKVVLIDNIQVP